MLPTYICISVQTFLNLGVEVELQVCFSRAVLHAQLDYHQGSLLLFLLFGTLKGYHHFRTNTSTLAQFLLAVVVFSNHGD